MIEYRLCFRTVDDVRKYLDIMSRFSVSGFVRNGSAKEKMYDILEILDMCSLDDVILVLTAYQKEDIEEIEKYLRQSSFFLQNSFIKDAPVLHIF